MTARTTSIVAILFVLVCGILPATGLAEVVGFQGEPESTDEDVADTTESSDQGDFVSESQRSDDLLASAPTRPPIQQETAHFLPVGPSILGDLEIKRFLIGAEADRRLLSELRKNVPDNRVEAEIYLARLKELAEQADPVRLAPKANRVLEQAAIYYDWLETEFETAEEEIYEYYIGGAQGFSRALEEFENAVLMTVMNRLDTAARALQEAYSESDQ